MCTSFLHVTAQNPKVFFKIKQSRLTWMIILSQKHQCQRNTSGKNTNAARLQGVS